MMMVFLMFLYASFSVYASKLLTGLGHNIKYRENYKDFLGLEFDFPFLFIKFQSNI